MQYLRQDHKNNPFPWMPIQNLPLTPNYVVWGILQGPFSATTKIFQKG